MKTMNSKERFYGLDIYRLMSMVMITILHVVNQHLGLLRVWLPDGSYITGHILKYSCFAGVNCFAVLSGYLQGGRDSGYDRKWLVQTLIFWFKIVFWGFGLLIVELICRRGTANWENLIPILLPNVSFWWYISAYCGMLPFIPLINRGIAGCSKREAGILVCILTVFFVIIPNIAQSSASMELRYGYSTLWLMVCFILGAVVKHCQKEIFSIRHLNLLAWCGLAIGITAPTVLHFFMFRCEPDEVRLLMDYLSPFCVLQALCMLIICIQIKITGKNTAKVISWLSANSLGIYLVQCYPWIWEGLVWQKNPPVYSSWQIAWRIPAAALVLIISGILMNFIIEKLYICSRIPVLINKLAGIVPKSSRMR